MNNNKGAAAVRHPVVVLATVLVAGLAVSSSAMGQQPEGLQVDVAECVKLESPGERLDCYERQVKRAQGASPAPAAAATLPPAASPPATVPPPAPAPRVAAPAPAVTPAPAPASAPPQRNVRVEEARVANGASTSSPQLAGTIVALREIVPNRWLITLNNGDAWRQTFAEWYPLQIGQRVEISQRRRFGSGYQMTAVGVNGNIQVELVR